MKSMLRRLAIAALAVSMLLGSAQAAVGARVTRDDLPIFNAPVFSQETYAGYLDTGATVGVIEVRGEWAKVTGGGKIGYTNVNYLEPISTGSADNNYATPVAGYATRSVTVYRGPSTSSGALATLPWGTQVYVTGTNGSFCRVTSVSGACSGYIPAAYLSRTQPTSTTRYATRDAVVYAQPASSSARLGYVPQGTAVRVIGQSGECFQVLNGSGMSCGYIYSGYLSSAPVEAYEPTPGYTTVPVKVYASPSTSSSVVTCINAGTAVIVTGVTGDFCKVSSPSGNMGGYIPSAYLSHEKPAPEEPDNGGSGSGGSQSSSLAAIKASVEMVDWYASAQYNLNRGSYYTLLDIRNGNTIRIKYTTGTSHMDIETATATDTAKLLTCLGGEWTYVRTPVILIAEGKCIAASLYAEPHGGTDTISGNNMDGVVCRHLANRRTHGSDRVDEDHQAAIQAAYNWAHS